MDWGIRLSLPANPSDELNTSAEIFLRHQLKKNNQIYDYSGIYLEYSLRKSRHLMDKGLIQLTRPKFKSTLIKEALSGIFMENDRIANLVVLKSFELFKQ